jgi:transposase
MNEQQSHQYSYNVDFYWKALAMYGIALLVYAALKGTFDESKFSLVISDPIVILLGIFVIGSSIALLINRNAHRTVIIGDNFIAFRNRFRERIFTTDSIVSIVLGKERRFKTGALKVVKIYVKNKRRPLRLRPSLFENEQQLLADLYRLNTLVQSLQ